MYTGVFLPSSMTPTSLTMLSWGGTRLPWKAILALSNALSESLAPAEQQEITNCRTHNTSVVINSNGKPS